MNAHNEQSSVVEKVAAEMREFYDAEMAPDDDVLKSWIDRLAAQPSPVVKQNLTTQPAAAQEAVAWLSKDEAQLALFKAIQAIRFGNPTDDKMILDNLRHEGLWIGRYANAPVTAAPVYDGMLPDALTPYSKEWYTLCERRFAVDKIKISGDLARAIVDAICQRQVSTPAAPGIDLAALRARVVSAIERITSGTASMRIPADMTDPDLVLGDVLCLLDSLGPQTDASPKGGSEALDAARWRYVRRKLCLTGNGDGTCGMQAINLPGSIPGWPDTSDDVVGFCEAAIDAAMQAQAGDAEVQP